MNSITNYASNLIIQYLIITIVLSLMGLFIFAMYWRWVMKIEEIVRLLNEINKKLKG